MDNKPKVGDTIPSVELGRKGRSLCVWDACPNCRIERWIRKQAEGGLCRVCAAYQRVQEKSTNHASTKWVGQEPQEGDVATAFEVGRRGKGYYTWRICPDCGNGRWLSNRAYAKTSPCFPCANKRRLTGETNPRWNGGVRYSPGHGYYVRVKPGHPFYATSISASGQKYIAEHRLVMAMHLGRLLERWEVVHHINGENTDNRLENLELLPSQTNHLPYNLFQAQMRDLQSRVTMLEAENIRLQSELEGKLIPSQAEEGITSLGVCRDLTGGIPNENGMKGKSMLAGNRETNMLWSLILLSLTSRYGVPSEQSLGKLAANSGNAKHGNVQANPDLAGEGNSLGKSRDFTLPILQEQDKEKVHPSRKLGDKGA